jgi:hypothetical protein
MPREGPLKDTNRSDEARVDVQSDRILHRLAKLPPASPFGSIEVGRAKEVIWMGRFLALLVVLLLVGCAATEKGPLIDRAGSVVRREFLRSGRLRSVAEEDE